jgi:KDO2-lipid IV(A) lauroyltransferase
MRGAFAALRANRWVAMLADQDARRHGVFVPFFGRSASTPVGPAALALRAGAPIIMGFDRRLPDGRHRLVIEPPLEIENPEASDAALRLTAAHTARLEARVREQPPLWFWLHRRWKTSPP